MNHLKRFAAIVLSIVMLFACSGCVEDITDSSSTLISSTISVTQSTEQTSSSVNTENSTSNEADISADSIPAYSGEAYIVLNGNNPQFSKAELTTKSYEKYSELDSLGRCGVTIASVGKDIMPTEDRGSIGSVKPTGWHTVKYDCVDGKYLYNRCHLIGFQLTGENANTRNLITGTRYLNIEGMLPFENMVADYVKETGNHVAYRVTPIFEGNNLVASGVIMEGYSIEDDGEGICFNVYCYNVQPGVSINYANGESKLSGDMTSSQAASSQATSSQATSSQAQQVVQKTYVLNTNTKKFHLESCRYADSIKAENRSDFTGERNEIINRGYEPCKVCNP